MRKVHKKEFKLKVTLEAIRGDLTLAEIVSKYQVSQSLIHAWKKQLMEEGSDIFDKRREKKDICLDSQKLHAKIGQLTLEKDFLRSCKPRGKSA